jgi:hypothetical protein
MLVNAGEDSIPRVNATLILSLLTGLNAIAIIVWFQAIFKIQILGRTRLENFTWAVPVMILNFLLVFYKKHYEKAEKTYSNSWGKGKNMNALIAIFYVIVTAILFWLSIRLS